VSDVFWWILGGGVLMSGIALVGAVTLVMRESQLRAVVLPLVALAAGSLLGGALFHMIPAAVDAMGNGLRTYVWVVFGFGAFLLLEQFLQWHHCHRTAGEHADAHRRPLGYLVLIADGVHNFIGGLAVAGAFLISIPLGITTWLAEAVHEVPQELGDFGVLLHSGWKPRRALIYNVISAGTFVAGGLLAYGLSFRWDVSFLVPFAAGNFLYIAAADLIPEINRHPDIRTNVLHFAAFALGIGLLFAVRLLPIEGS